MRVLLSTIGSRGDVQPLVALASQLQALGQEVHLCVPPDFRDWIDSLGIPVTPVGPELRQAAARNGDAEALSMWAGQGVSLARGGAAARRVRRARNPADAQRRRAGVSRRHHRRSAARAARRADDVPESGRCDVGSSVDPYRFIVPT